MSNFMEMVRVAFYAIETVLLLVASFYIWRMTK